MKKKNTTRKFYRRKTRVPRLVKKSYNGAIKLKRFSNLIDCSGFTLQSVGTNGLTEDAGSDCLRFTSNSTAGLVQFGAWAFHAALTDVTNASELTVLYDLYKIDRCKLTFIPYCTQANSGAAVLGTSTQSGLFLHIVKDYDDSVAPANSFQGLSTLRQYPGYRLINLMNLKGGKYSISFKPRVNTGVSNNASNAAGKKSEPFDWVDCESSDVAGYGLKGIFENVSAGSALQQFLRVEVCFYLSFRNPR